MEKLKEIAVLTKVSLDGQWQMFLKKKPDLVLDKKPFVALTMLYHPVTHEFVSRALGRLVESGQVDNDQEFLTKSYTFFQSQKPCLGMKPPDDNFPLSCQFSPYCSIMISKSSESKSCPACSQSLKDPLEIWQDPDKISMDVDSSQNDQTIKGSSYHLGLESDSSRKPTNENITVKDPLADEIHPGNLDPQLSKLEPDDDQTEFDNAQSSLKEILPNTTPSLNNGFETTVASPVDHVRIKFEPKTIEQFNQYGPIGVKGINASVLKLDRVRCYICKQLVPGSSLARHKMFRHQFGDFRCPKCCLVLPNPERLINHLTLYHPEVAKITCPNCRQDVKRGPKGEVFLSHVAICHKLKFLWEKETNHLVQFVGKDCMECLRSFDTEQQLQAHEAANFCYIKTTPKSTNDCKFKRNNDNTFTCLKCNNIFGRLQRLRRHDQRDHYGQILVCDHCGMQFKNEISFKRHINRKHPQSDELKCKRCDFYAGDATQLRNHTAIHGERKYLCTICGKKFVKPCNLTIHLRSHTGEKPYGCPSCNFRTATSGNLAVHVKNVHEKKAQKEDTKKEKETS